MSWQIPGRRRQIQNAIADVPELEVGLLIQGVDHDHDWGEPIWFDKPSAFVRGCSHCEAIERIPNPPENLHDPDVLEGWLNS